MLTVFGANNESKLAINVFIISMLQTANGVTPEAGCRCPPLGELRVDSSFLDATANVPRGTITAIRRVLPQF
jgi:hypothetical protein